jgi:hypothetical protein
MRVNEVSLKLYLDDLTKICNMIIKNLPDGSAFIALRPLLDSTVINQLPGFRNNCQVMVSGLLNLKKRTSEDSFARTLEKHAFESVPYIIRSVIIISNAAVERKYTLVIRDATISLYNIITTILNEKFLLVLNFDKEIKQIIFSISSFITEFFKSNEDLNFHLFDEILDVMALLGIQLVKYKKFDLANLVSSQFLAICEHTAKFDEFGYDTARTAKRIMMIGIYSIEINADQVTKRVLDLLDQYDIKVKNIAIEFKTKSWAFEELIREHKQYDSEFDFHEISPDSFLKQYTTDYSWSKFGSIVR